MGLDQCKDKAGLGDDSPSAPGYRLLNTLEALGAMCSESSALKFCSRGREEVLIDDLVQTYPMIRMPMELIQHASDCFRLLAEKLWQGVGLYVALELDELNTSAQSGNDLAQSLANSSSLQEVHPLEFSQLLSTYS